MKTKAERKGRGGLSLGRGREGKRERRRERLTLIWDESEKSFILLFGSEALLIIEDESWELFGEGVVGGSEGNAKKRKVSS